MEGQARQSEQKSDTSTHHTSAPGLDARKTSVRLLAAVVDARASLDALTDGEHGHPQYLELEVRDRALVRAILISALRHRCTIEKLISSRLERPLASKARTLSHILHVGAAQILFLDVPESAAVNLAVTQAKTDPRTRKFSGLVNGVLRNLARQNKPEALRATLASTRDAPDWFVDRMISAYGEETADAILKAHRLEAPVDFSVKSDPDHWAKQLGGVVLPNGSVRLDRLEAPVPQLPGYSDGAWWVQDAAASLPARLLGDIAGLSVADLCAAPGGKTAQLAVAGAAVTAVDQSANRLKRLRINLDRLGLKAEIVQADILKWAPERYFDSVLLDAPCSSTGTVRRHPDVLWTKTPTDIAKLADLQKRLLERATALVKVDGCLVYANCSLDPQEGEDLIEEFVSRQEDIVIDPIRPEELPGAGHFITEQGFLRTLPVPSDQSGRLDSVDGFFAARLKRIR